jgi:predicted nucleotidyltransferase
MKSLISHLLGDTRTAILAVLLLRPDEPQHVRELARLTGVSPGTLHRELTALESLGVLRRKAVGRQVFFAANRECPVFEELAGLVRKTAGLVDVVRNALLPQASRIGAAFIYGSVAAGTETSRSDVDVMILGDLPFADAVKALAPAQASLRREVNATVMKSAEFLRKRRAKDGFVSAVWKAPRLWVIGSDHELG